MSLPLGKIPVRVLRKILDGLQFDESVIVGPGVGIDAAVLCSRDNIIVSACDPITGASKEVGWLSVHVNANDIAASAAYPRWYIVTLLFPSDAREKDIFDVMDGIKRALREVKANLVAGHTELTNKVRDTIVIGTMIGTPMVRGRYVSNRGAKLGDAIVMTKGAGIEGTWILAETFCEKMGLSEDMMRSIREMKRMISVVRDAEIALNVGIDNIHAMHDATEGGVVGAVFEIAEASGVGFRIYEEKIIVRRETACIANVLSVDPLRLISSGTLILAVDREVAEELIGLFRSNGLEASIIGEIVEKDRVLVRRDGREERILEPPVDELWRILGGN